MQIRIDIPKDEQSVKIFVEEFGRGSRNITIPISDNKLEINVGNFYDIIANLIDEIPYTVKERENVENSLNAFLKYVYDITDEDETEAEAEEIKEEDELICEDLD